MIPVRFSFFALLLVACKPEPLLVGEPGPLPDTIATIGTAIAIVELSERLEHRAVVDDDGRVELPLCGPAVVGGAVAEEVCDRVAACLAMAIREPLVQVAFDRARASCSARGEPPPERDDLLEAVAARLPAAGDADVATELVDIVVDRHVALIHHTETHPEIVRGAERVQRLLETVAAQRSGEPSAAATHVRRRLVAVRRDVEEIADATGPKHPRRRELQRRIDALELLARAIGGPSPAREALDYVLDHESALLDDTAAPTGPAPPCPALEAAFAQRIAYWQGRRDESRDPTHADAILDGLLRARMEARTSCATR